MPPTPFVIRRAKAADKENVLAFCAQTFQWGDYLHLVWDEWLADETGPLLVATLNEEPVGVAKVTLLTPREAWLEGLRVHEAYRRHGLAWQFQIHCLKMARQRGAQVARLATSSKNLAVHKTAERAGMHRVAAVLPLEAQALPPGEGSTPLTCLSPQDWPQVATRILHGTALAQMCGLYGAGWTWQALTAEKLRRHLERGQVLALQNGDAEILAVAITSDVDPDDKSLPVGYVDGIEPHAQRLADGLRVHCACCNAEMVEVMIPADSPLHEAFVQSGYRPEMEAEAEVWIYELDLKGAAL
jgi:GNAT superfamily N-acetyltransferase